MIDQMSLPGLDAEEPSFKPAVIDGRPGHLLGYNLFLAIFPELEGAQRMASIALNLRRQHDLEGRCLRAERFHMTLHAVAGFARTIPQAVVDAAMAAAASVACPPLPIVFDRARSFRNASNPENNAFVLRCDARSDAAVARLRQSLAVALRQAGLRADPSSTPHMTMLYDRNVVAEHPIAPVRWTATRFALIVSHVGLGHHEWLGCWSLGNRP